LVIKINRILFIFITNKLNFFIFHKGCQLLQWKVTIPTIELDIQIILCGIVLILLPIFLASAIFKVRTLVYNKY